MAHLQDVVVVCCRYAEDAKWIREALANRLARFKLKLNEEKTHDVRFSKNKGNRGIKQGTFDFLGFTFYLGKTRKRPRLVPMLRTAGKRLRSKLKIVNEWSKRNRNDTNWNVYGRYFVPNFEDIASTMV